MSCNGYPNEPQHLLRLLNPSFFLFILKLLAPPRAWKVTKVVLNNFFKRLPLTLDHLPTPHQGRSAQSLKKMSMNTLSLSSLSRHETVFTNLVNSCKTKNIELMREAVVGYLCFHKTQRNSHVQKIFIANESKISFICGVNSTDASCQMLPSSRPPDPSHTRFAFFQPRRCMRTQIYAR